jgi:hypothetical protein
MKMIKYLLIFIFCILVTGCNNNIDVTHYGYLDLQYIDKSVKVINIQYSSESYYYVFYTKDNEPNKIFIAHMRKVDINSKLIESTKKIFQLK